MKIIANHLLAISMIAPFTSLALTLTSQDIAPGEFMSKKHEFKGFGCNGDNLSPHLAWQDVPKGTKSFAITAYDPDAPTGSGWWHWQVVDIPVSINELKTGLGINAQSKLPDGAKQISNDYGVESFGGACPPKGHGVHRYQFTIHALSVEKLSLPKSPSSALVGYMINANSLRSATVEALYQRD
ncbi:kinase inhibitor [Pseudoalteromonas sp. A25]|uniref:YbhB/YbcL family Raf kinase inhibitor-like protein n=1 Tax=Pseudoalteromonas sp. A25 TaxID=116092 RepID=UPI001260C172|nr:YbhB/YbcL family Raf kinase inhibitor-like protein [Pseudoalteromonas sp. A25]BBN83397.1 kinase inhibitor [Pseudoalteromonas sp. A25]